MPVPPDLPSKRLRTELRGSESSTAHYERLSLASSLDTGSAPLRPHPARPALQVQTSAACCPHCGAYVYGEEVTVWTVGAGWQRVLQFRCRGAKPKGRTAGGRPAELERHAWREVLETLGNDFAPAPPAGAAPVAPRSPHRPTPAPQFELKPAPAPAPAPPEAEEVEVPMPEAAVPHPPATVDSPLHDPPPQPEQPGAPPHPATEAAPRAGPKKYSPELKAEVRRLVREEGLNTQEAAERVGIPQVIAAAIVSWPRAPGVARGAVAAGETRSGQKRPAPPAGNKPKRPATSPAATPLTEVNAFLDQVDEQSFGDVNSPLRPTCMRQLDLLLDKLQAFPAAGSSEPVPAPAAPQPTWASGRAPEQVATADPLAAALDLLGRVATRDFLALSEEQQTAVRTLLASNPSRRMV
ncbi:MAG: hypothetical protein ACYCW6_21435 [Candidatus Xenobia bacterium]